MTLEQDFLQALAEARSKIDERLKIAHAAIKEAEDISEKYGIPFTARKLASFTNSYVPASIWKKWDDVDFEFLKNKTSIYDFSDPGCWEHSSCY